MTIKIKKHFENHKRAAQRSQHRQYQQNRTRKPEPDYPATTRCHDAETSNDADINVLSKECQERAGCA